MFEFIANNAYIFCIIFLVFYYLYFVGGDDIVFFRKKKYEIDPKSNERLNDALTRFARSRDFVVMGPTTIEFEGNTYSFDGILITYSGTNIFKTMPHIGETYAELLSDEWAVRWQGERKTIPNPLLSMKDNEKLFRDIYRAEGIRYGTTENMIAFTNKDAIVVASRSTPAFHVDDMGKKLVEAKVLQDNNADIQGMKAAIEKYIKK